MLHYYIGEYTPLAIGIMLCLLIAIKYYIINQIGIREGVLRILFNSFTVYSEYSIRNTFHVKLKRYYKSSNKVNLWFYTVIAFLVLAYLFILAISREM